MKGNLFLISRAFILMTMASLFFTGTSFGQQNNSLYFMDGIPQSNQLNPATQPRFNFYFGMPALSSLEINAGNSAVRFSDIFLSNVIPDSLVFPLYNANTRSNFLSKFKKNNFVSTDLRIDLLSFGFRINDSYLSFSVGDRVTGNLNLPYGLLDLLVNGNISQIPETNGTAKTFDLSGLGGNATWYREYSLGFSQQINNQIYFGVRGKLLFGKANIQSENSNILLKTGVDTWEPQAVININSSVPDLRVIYTQNNTIDSVKFENDGHHDVKSILMNKKNLGVALDMGVIYKPINDLSLEASIVDLGFIHWKNNVNNAIISGSYLTNGVPLSLSDTANLGKEFLDTLKNAFTFTHDQNSYLTSLSGKVYLGALYQPVKWIGLGALSRFQLLDHQLNSQYTLSLNLYPAKWFNYTLSYTIVDRQYSNFGMGFYLKTGPLQWYFMSDRIPLYWDKIQGGGMIPAYSKSFNFHMGINLVFGSERHRRIKKDRPLVEI